MITKPKPGAMLNPLHPLSKGLAGFWLMNEGAGSLINDISGNKNHGSLKNMAPNVQGSGWGGSKHGGSLKFDGVDDYVDIGDVTNLELNFPLTIISWINLDTLPSSDESYEIISKYYSTGDKREWRFYVSSSSDKLSFWKGIDGTSTGAESITSDTAFLSGDLGNWFQAAVTIDGDGNGNIYRNGVNDKSSTFSNTTIYHSSAKAMIGCLNRSVTAPDNLFDGSIDNVRIYNRALSAEEVRLSYEQPFCMMMTPRITTLLKMLGSLDKNNQFLLDSLNCKVMQLGNTRINTWNTLGRPTAKRGIIGFNTTTNKIEVYDGSAWKSVSLS